MTLIILALVGGLIGWTTNVIAIKLLFKPLEPVNILGFKLQGVIPKRKHEIAKSIGDIVEEELLSAEEIIEEILAGTDKSDVIQTIKERIIAMTEGKLPAFIPAAFAGMITTYIEDLIDEKGGDLLDEITESLIHKATSSVSISKMVEKKITMFDLEQIEQMVIKIAKTELKHIEYLGGILGLVIGIVQGILIMFI